MPSPTSRVLRVAASVGVLLGAGLSSAGPSAADPGVPFQDSNARGTLGFCDRSGHEITSGRIGDAPFAWTAVSSAGAPAGYEAGKGRASLFVYQPIQFVDPGDWSGKQMTAASKFTSTAHPMAQATAVDPALVDFVSVFPAHWQGLVQLRMFFSAPDKPQVTQQYPAAVVQVKGDAWHLVAGGHPACGVGKAVSAETIALPKSVVNPAAARSTPNAPRPGGGSAGVSAGGSTTREATGAGGSSTLPRGSAGNLQPAADATHSGSDDSGSGAAWWIALLAAAAAGAGALTWRRFRRGASPGSS